MSEIVYDRVLEDLRHVACELRWLGGDSAHITVHLPESEYEQLSDDMSTLGGWPPKETWDVAGDGSAVSRMTLLGGALRIERPARMEELKRGGYDLV